MGTEGILVNKLTEEIKNINLLFTSDEITHFKVVRTPQEIKEVFDALEEDRDSERTPILAWDTPYLAGFLDCILWFAYEEHNPKTLVKLMDEKKRKD